MEQEVNNFVRDVQRLGRARSDFGILKYTANINEDFYLLRFKDAPYLS